MADELDVRQSPVKKVPAWQLREKLKKESAGRPGPAATFKPKKNHSLDGGIDPSLPPAFRAAAMRRRRQDIDDFNSMDSVHSSKSHMSAKVSTPTTNGSDSDSDSTFDGHDSFASLGVDSDDDEAYREGRNQMARQSVESNRSSKSPTKGVLRSNDFRRKGGMGIQGTPLDFIAE